MNLGVLTLFLVLTGWDEEICCFVITPVAFDEEDVALDDDDDAASAEDAPTLAVDDATLAEDVFAFDLTACSWGDAQFHRNQSKREFFLKRCGAIKFFIHDLGQRIF